MHYIVLDLEWNQAATKKDKVTQPLPLEGEIIQLGAVKLDDHFCQVSNFEAIVKPKCYTHMHWMVKKLTGITDKDLRGGRPFLQVYDEFCRWCGDEYVFLTWGDGDLDMLRGNLAFYGQKTADLPRAYDVQIIFDAQVGHENRCYALPYALEKMGEPALEAHDALHDAINTYRVCRHLDMKAGLSAYQDRPRRAEKGNEKASGKKTPSRRPRRSNEKKNAAKTKRAPVSPSAASPADR